MRLKGPYQPSRGLAVGKTIYVKVLRGQLIACKWPKKRPRVTHPTTLEQMERFRQANWLAKYAPAPIQMAHRKMVEGTQLLPRDLMVAAMLGRGLTTTIPGQRRRYPVAAIRDLSDTLDILGAVAGDILGRGGDRWMAITPAQAGLVLVSSAPGEPPQWQGIQPGGGLWTQIEDVTLAVPLALNAYRQVSIPANAQELEWTLWVPNSVSGVGPTVKINNAAGTSYFQNLMGTNSSGTFVHSEQTSQAFFRLFISNPTPPTARIFARGRVFQAASSERAGFWSDSDAGGNTLIQSNGLWLHSGSAKISQLGFGSQAGQGLPAGTRLIVRATIPA